MNDESLAALRRIADDGFRRISTGLSEFTGVPIETTATDVRLLPTRQVPDLVGGPEVVVVGVYLAIQGDVQGHMILILPELEGCELADILLEQPKGTTLEVADMAASALGEVGNITSSLLLNSLADAAALRLCPSPPSVVVDMGGAILDIVLAELSMVSDEVLVVDATFSRSKRQVNSLFLMLLRPDELQIIIDRISAVCVSR